MKKLKGIVESSTPPSTTDVAWLYRGVLKHFSRGKWTEVGGGIKELPDGSITIEKLADDVQEAINNAGGGMTEIPDGGVTTEKIANGAVTNAKVATGAIKLANLADEVKAQLGVNTPEGAVAANAIYYDNSASGLDSANVQGAIDNAASRQYAINGKLYKDELLSADISDWTAGLLEPKGTILNGFNGHTSDFIEVEGGVDIIEHRGKNNYDTVRPTVLGYRADKSVYGILLAGITDTKKVNDPLYAEYAYIPLEVKYVRLSSNGNEGTFSFRRLGIGNLINENGAKDSENLYSPYIKGLNKSGVESFNGGGTDYIPVHAGMTIYTSANGFSDLAGICLFDKDKQFIRYVEEFQATTMYAMLYNFTQDDVDSGIAYVRGSFSPINYVPSAAYPRINHFFYVLDKYGVDKAMSLHLLSQLVTSNALAKNNHIRNIERIVSPALDVISASLSGKKVTVNKLGYFRVNYPTDGINLVENGDSSARFTPKGFVRMYLIRIRMESGTNGSVGYNGINVLTNSGMQAGDYAYIPYSHDSKVFGNPAVKLLSDGDSTWEIIDVYTFNLNDSLIPAFLDTTSQTSYDRCFLGRCVNSLFERFSRGQVLSDITVADIALSAETCRDNLPDQYHVGKSYVAYGTSITANADGNKDGYPTLIANKFGMMLTNLGKSGSNPTNNLTDENLAKIPSDTMLVTICFGANSWITSEDINSRDRENSIGAINYAIDYILENTPNAIICLGIDKEGRTSQQCKDLIAIAENRNVPFAHTYLFDMGGTRRKGDLSYDGTHLTVQGAYRMAAIFINEISKYIYIGR